MVFVAFLVYGALACLSLAAIAASAVSAPVWQAPALFCISGYLWWLAFDVVRGDIGL